MPLLLLSTIGMLVALPSTFCLEAEKPNVYEFRSTTFKCSAELVKDTITISEDNVHSIIECARLCATKNYCDLAVYWKSPDGQEFCTKLFRTRPPQNSTSTAAMSDVTGLKEMLERDDYSFCRVFKVNRCQNGGNSESEDNVCSCKDGYLGEICEFEGSYCDPGRYQAYTYNEHSKTSDFSLPNLEIAARNSEHTVKVFDQNLRADIFITGTKSYYGKEELSLSTSESVELTSWDSFADPVRREFCLFGKESSERILVTVANKTQQWERKNLGKLFSIISLRETRFLTHVAQQADNKEAVLEHLWKGHEVGDSNYATGKIDVKEDYVKYQLTGVELKTSPGHKSFETPIAFQNTIMEVGGLSTTRFVTLGVGGQAEGSEQPAADLAFNPCWFQPMNDYHDIPESVFLLKLTSSLQKGHRIRIRTKAVYYTLQEVRQSHNKIIFVLAPHIDGPKISQMILSSDKQVKLMYCSPETTTFRRANSFRVDFLTWFADARGWKKVLTVSSGNSVTFGSVSDLVAQIEAAVDVRVWVHSPSEGRSRYLDINKRLVTKDKKVSGVSVVSSQVLEASDYELTRTCGLETVLVTSEGVVKVMRFNVDSTERTMEVMNDVVVTWFVN